MTTKPTKQPSVRREIPGNAGASDLAGVELDVRRSGRVHSAQILKSGRTPLKVIEVAETVTALAENAVRNFAAKHPPPRLACKEGCDWCCHFTVGTSVPEVIRIAKYLRDTLSPAALQATLERVVALDEQRKHRKAARITEPPLPCPLLVEHRCSVYPVRPLTCRGCNSTDPDPCEAFLHSRKVPIPMYSAQHRLATFALDGMRAGLAESKLSGELLELPAALRIALEMPDAVERWAAGHAVFAPARMS